MIETRADRIASISPVSVHGTFYRHAAPNRDAFAGGVGGRWGEAFPVIYLGRPRTSVIAEAYRHLVEEAGVPAEHVRPRTLYTVEVRLDAVLDLTSPENLAAVGLTDADLMSPVGDYVACQAVAAVAHALARHAILAPAATGIGETLAVFREHIDLPEQPAVLGEAVWNRLPPDPRVLRAVPPSKTPPHRA